MISPNQDDASTSTFDNENKSSTLKQNDDGIWVGIDFGTSNCACAVWDSTRGGAKWIRLADIATPQSNYKDGRLVPSIVWLSETIDDGLSKVSSKISSDLLLYACVGHQVEKMKQTLTSSQTNNNNISENVTIIQSAKRIIGKQRIKDLDPDFAQSLPFKLFEADTKKELQIQLSHRNYISPVSIAAIILNSIKVAAEQYLKQNISKKRLMVPGNGTKIRNVVVGVPAHFTAVQKQVIKDACHMAGFDGKIATMIESTAAIMAYGLFLDKSHDGNDINNNNKPTMEQTVLVLDMGGGTTDVTIAKKKSSTNDAHNSSQSNNISNNDHDSAYKVVATAGDSQLGGDDMDQVLLDWCLNKIGCPIQSPSESQKQSWKQACRVAKEALCGTPHDPPQSLQSVNLQSLGNVTLTQEDMEKLFDPLIQRVKKVIHAALSQLVGDDENDPIITEVVLVGGATRVPSLRQMVKNLFPSVELCTSLDPMGSVAQGLAIHGAFLSKQIPAHELRSALMLDCLPHAMGVASPSPNGGPPNFCELIPHHAQLPAKGTATFILGNLYQKGVTIQVVEKVQEDDNEWILVPVGDFNFLLHRLNNQQLSTMDQRSIDVGMIVESDGAVKVSIFDENDPDDITKKGQFEQLQNGTRRETAILEYVADYWKQDEQFTSEQKFLLLACIGAFVLYICSIIFLEPIEFVD